MANVYLDAPSGNANIRMVFTSGGNYLRADNGALEAFSAIATYQVSPTDSVALSSGLARYRFIIPTPAVLPVTLDLMASDIVTDEILGDGTVRLDADGNEMDDAASLESVLANMNAIKAKTDNLPAEPAAVGSQMALEDGAITNAKFAADAISASTLASDAVTEIQTGLATSAAISTLDGVADSILALMGDFYYARIIYVRDQADAEDKYSVQWFKSRELVSTGITSPKLSVAKYADGADLIPATAMAEIGPIGAYKYTASGAERLTKGEMGIAEARATIDGMERVWREIVGRDSN